MIGTRKAAITRTVVKIVTKTVAEAIFSPPAWLPVISGGKMFFFYHYKFNTFNTKRTKSLNMKNFGDSPKLGAPTVGLCLRPSLVFIQITTVSVAGSTKEPCCIWQDSDN